MTRQNIFLLFAFAALLFGCRKNDAVVNPIPNITFETFINLNLPQYQPLELVGNYAYATGGYKGLLIYRYSPTEFRALDRACSFDPFEECHLLSVDTNAALWINCACCESRFDFNGFVTNGPALAPMRQYQLQYNPDLNSLRIYNF